ncbi:hypothetical protein [Pedococcus bigeumensis]|uniref:hypothetical protein n=1 Tax=Pedococcus bigeumensis TaxID=433644 RepID=UPI002FEA367E
MNESQVPHGAGDMERIARIMYSMEIDEIDMPHVVVTNISGCALATYSGPYASGLAALAVAEAERRADLAAGGSGDVRFSVAPLYPGLDLQDLQELPAAHAEPESGPDCG